MIEIQTIWTPSHKTQEKQAKDLNRWHWSYYYTLEYEPYSNGQKLRLAIKDSQVHWSSGKAN